MSLPELILQGLKKKHHAQYETAEQILVVFLHRFQRLLSELGRLELVSESQANAEHLFHFRAHLWLWTV